MFTELYDLKPSLLFVEVHKRILTALSVEWKHQAPRRVGATVAAHSDRAAGLAAIGRQHRRP
jgi:hypothetical protein